MTTTTVQSPRFGGATESVHAAAALTGEARIKDAAGAIEQAGEALESAAKMGHAIDIIIGRLLDDYGDQDFPELNSHLEAMRACAEKLTNATQDANARLAWFTSGGPFGRAAAEAAAEQGSQLEQRAAKADARRFATDPEPITGFGALNHTEQVPA